MSYEPTIWRTGDTVTAEKLNKIEQAIVADNTAIEGKVGRDEFDTEIATLESKVGSPLIASTVSEMTETDRVYVYTGSETGYTSGNWYYYDGTAWTSGGVYNAVAIETDTTLSVSGKVADAKKVGDELSSLKEDLNAETARAEAEEARIEALFTGDVSEAVNDWLDAHPEATTTVQDGSITEPKLLPALSKNLLKKDETYRVVNVSSENRALCVALIDKNNHAILFDLSDTYNALGVINALNDVVNVDSVCISHYHWDHIGDYETIFATVPHDECKFYIPEAPDATYFSSLNTVANNFITWIGTQTGCEIHYPEEGETVKINDVKITFNNADPSYWYENYAVGDLNYNWLSVAAYVEFGGTSMQITGDLYTESEKYFFETLKAGKKADIYQAPHHGLSHYYVNGYGLMSVNPKVILINYGTNNDYIASRKFSSAIVDFASELGIPAFDTKDNGTFEIVVNNGGLSYEGLKPFITTPTLDNYAYIRGLVLEGSPVEYSIGTHGIKEILKMMPSNSAITINASSSYKIISDFGLNVETIIKVQKFVGGSTNYLWDRTDPSQFYFNIDLYTREFGRNHFNFHGRYRDSDGFTVYDSAATKPVVVGFTAKKLNGTDTYLTITKLTSVSRGVGINIVDDAFTVTRTGLYETSIAPYSVDTSMDLSFHGNAYYMRNGGTVTRVATLIAGTRYQITSDNNNTSSVYGHIKLLAYSDSVAFPS